MKMDLPKTREIWMKFIEATDTNKLYVKYREMTGEIESAKDRLANSESMEEFHSISKEIQSLQDQLTAIEIEKRTQPVREKNVRNNEMKQLPDVYNQEFQPYYDKYLKLDKELKKQLQKFAEATEPIAKEMREIEQLESSYHLLKIKTASDYKRFIKLPIDPTILGGTSSPALLREYGVSSGVNRFISGIKKITSLLR